MNEPKYKVPTTFDVREGKVTLCDTKAVYRYLVEMPDGTRVWHFEDFIKEFYADKVPNPAKKPRTPEALKDKLSGT